MSFIYAIFYLSKMILKQLKKGDNYNELNKTITINILDFNYIDTESFHTSYRLYEDKTKKLLSDIIEINFIELEKFKNIKNKDYNNKLHKWLSFLNNPEGKEMDLMRIEDAEIKEAMDILYEISGDTEIVQLAELRDKAIIDEKSRLSGAKEEGREQGREEGREEAKFESTKNLLRLGISYDIVIKAIGLSKEKVDELYKEVIKELKQHKIKKLIGIVFF